MTHPVRIRARAWLRAHPRARQRWRRLRRPAFPGRLRRRHALGAWGYDRGTPIDRLYIEAFLEEHRADVRGRVLEVKDDAYARRFGGAALTAVDVLDIDPANPRATIHADLAAADAIPDARFDCVVLTQTLQYVHDVPAAVGHLHRMLAPGGVLLVTLPCMSRIAPGGDFWRFTPEGCAALFGAAFGADAVEVRARGNVLAATSFLMGMAVEELPRDRLLRDDPELPLLVCVRAVRRRPAG
jgi:SAM-dependent methyltransferase